MATKTAKSRKKTPANGTANGSAEAVVEAAPVELSEEVIEEAPAPEPEPVPEETDDERALRLSRMIVEDFVVTLLLSRGRSATTSDISSAAEGWTLSKNVLKAGMEGSALVHGHEREWELALRERIKSTPRDLRGRSPLESTLRTLLSEIGKPLPLPVIAREASTLRGTYPEYVRDQIASALASARWAVEVRDKTYLPADLLLDTGAPSEELVARANKLSTDPDFPLVRELSAPSKGDLATRAAQVLEAAGRPLTHKALGFVLWRADKSINLRELAQATADRSKFYAFTGGRLSTQTMLAMLRAESEEFLRAGAGGVQVDIGAILRQRLLPAQIVAPSEPQMEEARSFAQSSGGASFSVGALALDVLEMEPEAPDFAARVQGLNDALRRSPEFLPAGIGRYVLRSAVPPEVGQVPDRLRPVSLSVRVSADAEPLDVEMSDEGLEGDAVEFVHSPDWEDVAEEVEVRLPRRTGEVEASTRIVVLNHHWESGTLKLRRKDEDFFALEGAFSRINLRAHGSQGTRALGLWSSRESGLVYGLREWFEANLPGSGGVIEMSRDPQAPLSTPIEARVEEPDKATFIDEARLLQLRELRESATYLSLFELLQAVMADTGATELPAIWAQVNAVRRTTKRALCSILCAYSCYSFKQRGPQQFLWRYDAAKLDQGFKKNKRKFVRR